MLSVGSPFTVGKVEEDNDRTLTETTLMVATPLIRAASPEPEHENVDGPEPEQRMVVSGYVQAPLFGNMEDTPLASVWSAGLRVVSSPLRLTTRWPPLNLLSSLPRPRCLSGPLKLLASSKMATSDLPDLPASARLPHLPGPLQLPALPAPPYGQALSLTATAKLPALPAPPSLPALPAPPLTALPALPAPPPAPSWTLPPALLSLPQLWSLPLAVMSAERAKKMKPKQI